MKLAGIYGITDSSLTPGQSLLTAVEQALEGGISLLQYRDKQSDPAQRRAQAKALQVLCAAHQVPLLINDDVQLCLQSGAAGVHLGQQDTDILAARRALGDQAIIGITCHADLALASRAEQSGASYVAFGRFFPSQTKPAAPPAELDLLVRARERLSIPIVAIGGIDASNAAAAVAAGADMLAVINYLFSARDIASRARELNAIYRRITLT
ncbi:MAG: thiamine phosphate synthase [Gammaproteobacteria bacterium]|jgi:thiamine-phosphate pyrophosphorylase